METRFDCRNDVGRLVGQGRVSKRWAHNSGESMASRPRCSVWAGKDSSATFERTSGPCYRTDSAFANAKGRPRGTLEVGRRAAPLAKIDWSQSEVPRTDKLSFAQASPSAKSVVPFVRIATRYPASSLSDGGSPEHGGQQELADAIATSLDVFREPVAVWRAGMMAPT
jgi:hypothetical protein